MRALTVMVLGMTSVAALAQEPFTTIEVRASGTANINRNLLHTWWQGGWGANLVVSTPFYRGTFEFGSTVHRYDSKRDTPGFGALMVQAGWSPVEVSVESIAVRPIVRLGNYRMSFDPAEQGDAGADAESELVTGLGLGLSRPLSEALSLHGGIDYLRIHTRPFLHLWYVSLGVGMQFESSRLLRRLLE